VLHLHGQRFPHDAVEVFGTSTGLERFINALIDGVNTGHGRCQFLTRDGCDAEVRVACLDGRRREEDWRRSGSPYLDVDDPHVARIMELTEEVGQLRLTVQLLRAERKKGTAPPV
jgi:hypothetical protein